MRMVRKEIQKEAGIKSTTHSEAVYAGKSFSVRLPVTK